MQPQLTEAQMLTELELVRRLQEVGLRFDRRRVNLGKEPHFVEGFVEDVHVWIYSGGGASIVGRGADLMIEKEDYDSPEELRTGVIDRLMELF